MRAPNVWRRLVLTRAARTDIAQKEQAMSEETKKLISGLIKKLPVVRDYMIPRSQLHVVSPELPIMSALDILLGRRVSGSPVVDPITDELVGILSEKDCLKLVATGQDHDLPTGFVRDYMTVNVFTIPPKMDIYYAAGLFMKHDYRRFPVVEDKRLLGQVSRRDIMRACRQHLD